MASGDKTHRWHPFTRQDEWVAGNPAEPLVQGVNQIRPWPEGMLAELRQWCDLHGIHLILGEVMTGFGRTGTMFACQREGVIPDFLCLAKGLTGGYLPMAATMVRGRIYDAFSGDAGNAFYYGHSYTASNAWAPRLPRPVSANRVKKIPVCR